MHTISRIALFACASLLASPSISQTGQADGRSWWYLSGERSAAQNSDGAVVANLASGRTAAGFVRLAGRTPIIWARYNPGSGTGIILVSRIVTLPDNSVSLTLRPFKPSDGAAMASGGVGRQIVYYGGINPFAAFDSGGDYFTNATFSAFLAATGLVMRSVNTSVAFVYHPAILPAEISTTTGEEALFSPGTSVSYRAEGRWLMALSGESGDQRGFIPGYRVAGCNPLVDVRNGCIVKGFASFVPFNDGNLPSTGVVLGTRAGQIADLAAATNLFTSIETLVRESALWSSSAWGSVVHSGELAATTFATFQSMKRRDQITEVNAEATQSLATTSLNGIRAAGTAGYWDITDAATAEFIVKPLAAAGGGISTAVGSASWQTSRDKAVAQDVRNRDGTTARRQDVFETTAR